MKSVCESTFTQGELSKYVVRGTFTVSWCTPKVIDSRIDSARSVVFPKPYRSAKALSLHYSTMVGPFLQSMNLGARGRPSTE